MKRDQQFANIRRINGPEKEAPGVLAIEVELVAELSTGPTGRTVTPIRTAGGGNPAVLSPLSPLAVPLLLKPLLVLGHQKLGILGRFTPGCHQHAAEQTANEYVDHSAMMAACRPR